MGTKTHDEEGAGLSLDTALTAAGICGAEEHPASRPAQREIIINDEDLDVPEDSMDGRHGVRHYPDRLKT